MIATLCLVTAASVSSAGAEGQRDKNAVQNELELARASDAEVEATATRLAQVAAGERSHLADAEQAEAVAQQEADEAARSLAQVIAKTKGVKQTLARAAVDEYVHPSGSDALMLLAGASSPEEAARRQAFATVMANETSAALEQLRGAKDDRATAERRLAAASALAAQRAKEQRERTQAAEAASQEQEKAHAELQHRIADLVRQNEGLVAADAQAQALLQASPSFDDAPPARVSQGGLIWPVSGIVTSEFGPRSGGFHPGIDIAAAEGTPIAAAKGGVVVFAGWNDGGYGNFVILDNGGGIGTAYAHQSQIAVSAGETVSQGETIGYVGSTGFSTGPHLHFEVRVNGTAQNPRKYLP